MNREAIYSGVSRAAWAQILLYLNINLGTVNILPNWLGYYLLWKGIGDLEEALPSLRLLRPFCLLLGLFEGFFWILELFGMPQPSFYPLTLVLAAVRLYLHFQYFTDLARLAARYPAQAYPKLPKKLLWGRTIVVVLGTMAALPIDWTRWAYAGYALLFCDVVMTIYLSSQLFHLRRVVQAPTDTM